MNISFGILSRAAGRSGWLLIDLAGMILIVFMPEITRLLGFPFYLLDPLRLVLVLAIAHSPKANAYVMAALLPVISHLAVQHPHLIKTLLIVMELLLNSWLFYRFTGRNINPFTAMLAAIVIAKAVYYGMKYLMIVTGLIVSELISTPVYLQFITAFIFSAYIYVTAQRSEFSGNP
ncbi:MAG: hypothetical protein JW861_14040 [Bacteroidales bacterium]|nr:hypothetical protein [Bacteroidales bacterium]